MKAIIAALTLVAVCTTIASAAEQPKHRITFAQARALVVAALEPGERKLPKLGMEISREPPYLGAWVNWQGLPEGGSSTVGFYAVDPHTGDVWDENSECHEMKNPELQKLQVQIRKGLGLSQSEYLKLKTKGPMCP